MLSCSDELGRSDLCPGQPTAPTRPPPLEPCNTQSRLHTSQAAPEKRNCAPVLGQGGRPGRPRVPRGPRSGRCHCACPDPAERSAFSFVSPRRAAHLPGLLQSGVPGAASASGGPGGEGRRRGGARIMPPKFTFRETREIGEEFIAFLKDSGRRAVSDKEELRAVYNEEFRKRDNERRPNFSSVLYVLRQSGRAGVTEDTVQFGAVKKKVKFANQYWRPGNYAGGQTPHGPGSAADPPPRRSRAKDRAEFVSEKHGVDIVSQHDLSNGRIRFPVSRDEAKTITILVKNKGAHDVTLCNFRKLRKSRELTFVVSQPLPVGLLPGTSCEISVRCLTHFYGYFATPILFEFISEQNELFTIGRFVSAVANSRLAEQLAPSADYRPYQASLRKPQVVTTEPGFLPDDSLPYELEKKILLEQYPYPAYLKDLVSYLHEGCVPNDSSRAMVAKLRTELKATLEFNNYCEKFKLLLHLEEIQMEVDIRRYDMVDVCMEADPLNSSLLVLKVPGVAENRPSVLRGDHLFVTLADNRGQSPVVRYQGYVHAVELEKVKLGFSPKLRSLFIKNMKFDVTFTFNRLPLRVQHRAVFLAQERQLQHLLFPSFSYRESLLSDGQRLSLYDLSLERNEEQRRAVHQVVAGTSRPAPYLIFGPPGTGKTVTMVEAIKQVLRCIEGSHVLACAPSNSAADLLCQHLIKHVDKRNIYRLNAYSRDYRLIPEDIKPYCNWDNAMKCPIYPSKEKLESYRVIITTLVTAGRLVSADFPRGHFSHVFIDESGHAVEPESLIAIAGLLAMMDPKTNAKGGQLVLAGDPQQLGPILRSPLAIEYGLELSLLERLMHDNPLYQKKDGGFNPQFVTKLLRNYRSHRAILKFPNEKFYEGELQVHADPIIANSYCSWSGLAKQGFPIIFHGVCGEDQREEKSPSFFNTAEIEVLIDYLKKLLLEQQGKKGLSRISPKEIGIISPYRKQVEKIRKGINISELKNLADVKDLKVGSVEEFQGQERRVLLISTVRSRSEYIDIDEKFNLGFLKNPKRFNVAVTRPKALLIVIGNPTTLKQDIYWGEFLKYCRDNGAYRGYPYEEEENEEDDVLAAELNSLSLNRQPAGHNLAESHIQQQAEPAWRHEH
uniref:helicase MOV-10 n=1 Tax=Euleptes europaea TaxID=460621 RepID=UPI00253F6847|nr:helicase MOV-10 [Euleptes europaea]